MNALPSRAAVRKLECVAVLLMLAVSGCSAVGVVETSDPRGKIAQANTMEGIGRIAVAKRLILEAAEIYRENGDELGLAEAYRRYAFFVRANGEDTISRVSGSGLQEMPTNHDGRIDKAILYFEMALEIAQRHQVWDLATNLHYNIGVSYYFAQRVPEACAAYDKSLETFTIATRLNPQGVPDLPVGVKTYPELVERAKKETLCP